MADDIGGIWRTIGGRRVFIKTGHSLQQAMKESGKFKTSKEKEFEKATQRLQEEDIVKALVENEEMNEQLPELRRELETADDMKRKEFLKATIIRYENQIKENQKNILKNIQNMADREGVLPSEVQDRYRLTDTQLGLETDEAKHEGKKSKNFTIKNSMVYDETGKIDFKETYKMTEAMRRNKRKQENRVKNMWLKYNT